jgi:hypothetical protein
MECLGYRTFEEFCTAIERFDASRIDSRRIAAARAEVDKAERHFFDTAEMKIPVPSSPPPAPAPTAAPQQPAAWGQPQRPAPRPQRPLPQPAAHGPRWAAS